MLPAGLARRRECEVLQFATWIGGQAPSERRRALRLLGLVLHDGLLDLRIRGLDTLGRALHDFKRAAAAGSVDFYREMLRLLERLPRADDAGFRFSFLRYWCFRRVHHERGVVPLLREIRRYLSGRPDAALIDPWLDPRLDEGRYSWINDLLESEDERSPAGESEFAIRERCRTVFDALAQSGAVSCKRPVTYADGSLIVNLAVATGDAGDACKRFVELDEAGLRDEYEYLDHGVLRLAHELDAQRGRFAILVSALREESDYA